MRNSIIRRFTGAALALVTAASLLAIPGGAVSTVPVTVDPSLNIVIDGQTRNFYNAQGQEVHPVTWNGSTYLPIRAIGELMGKNVDWNDATNTATLSSSQVTSAMTGTPDANPISRTVRAEVHDDYTIVVDGTVRTFRDADGRQVYPLLFEGSNYLPLRSIGELMGKTVHWDGATRSAVLSGGSVVPDADTFSGGQSGSQTGPITVEQAKQKVLEHAGLSASQVTFVEQKLERENGRQVYEIEFYTASLSEYDYEIDATTGAIVSFDQDAELYTPSSAPGQGANAGIITVEQAKQKALEHAKLTAAQVSFTEQKLDRDDGRQVYDIEFHTADFREYDYEIDATTGAVLSWDQDGESYTPAPGQGTGTTITKQQAEQIALAKVPGATAANIRKSRLDRDDGVQVYEIEIRLNGLEYEFEIDAATGAIRSMDRDD